MGQLVRVSRQSVHIGSDTWTQQTLSRVHPFSCVDSSMFVSLTAVLGNGTVLSGAIWMSWFLKKTNLQPVTWRHLQSKLWNTNYEPFYFCPTILVCSNYTINSGRIKLPNKPKNSFCGSQSNMVWKMSIAVTKQDIFFHFDKIALY